MTGYRTNTLKQIVVSGRTAIGTGSHEARDAATFHTIAAAGADYVFIDLEHASMSIETTATLIWHCHGAGVTPLVRVPTPERMWITKILDAGGQSVLVPQVRDASDVRLLIENAKYAPAGRRGAARYGSAATNFAPVPDVGTYAEFANDNVFLGINVETPEAVENLDELLMPGLDFVNVGSQDLALLYGIGSAAGRRLFEDALAHVRNVCKQRGVARGSNPDNLDGVRQAMSWGANMITYAGLLTFLRRSLAEAVDVVRQAPGEAFAFPRIEKGQS